MSNLKLSLILLFFATTIFSVTNISNCQLVNNVTDTVYTLNTTVFGAPFSVSPFETACFVFNNTSNIIFDCQGNSIIYNGTAGSNDSMWLNSTKNITIKN